MSFLRTFLRDQAGAMLIETAFVVPVLAVLCFGGLETSRVIARDTELQTALAESVAIALAKAPEADPDMDTIKGVIMRSTGLTAEQVTMVRRYRCGTADPTNSAGGCAEEDLSSFIQITLQDSYAPMWTSFGIGESVEFTKTRTIQIS